MGFRPSKLGDACTVEYSKDYAQPDGRLARLTAVFSKAGFMQAMDQAQLIKFVVTVQGTIDPVPEEVEAKAPPVLVPDMLAALQTLEGVTIPDAELSAHCDHCGQRLTEWTVDDSGRIQCLRPDICPEYDDSP